MPVGFEVLKFLGLSTGGGSNKQAAVPPYSLEEKDELLSYLLLSLPPSVKRLEKLRNFETRFRGGILLEASPP